MTSRCRLLSSVYGFYIAMHPWLKKSGYVKVGYTANLSCRLEMTSFTTCFTPEWSYFAVFELESIKEAFLLEQAVLFFFKDKRVSQRELIQGSAMDVVDGARRVCAALNLNAIVNMQPSYNLTERTACDRSGKVSFLDVSSTCDALKSTTLGKYIETLEKLRESIDACSVCDNVTVEEGEIFDENEEVEYNFDILDSFKEESFSLTALRPYQQEAVARCNEELESSGVAICQMACRCGKTPVAFKLIEHCLQRKHDAKVLYLVPGLTLLRQTAIKLYSYGLNEIKYLLIGSYPSSVLLGNGQSLMMTTDAEVVEGALKGSSSQMIIISTYHSSHILSKHSCFDLTVFDECHRVCGSASVTNFNSVLFQPRSGKRLFLTATPAYDTPIKMDNVHLFGGIAYRYYLREGIDNGYVNAFSLRIILGENMDDMNPYFYEAMRIVDKMIVYCQSIEHAIQLATRLQCPFPGDVVPFGVMLAHSRMGGTAVATTLCDFSVSKRCILFNVRLFQEGVEIPDLNAVFFAAPRYSSRDIIQSICRPLNRMENKPKSYVFLPATIDNKLPEAHPVNLQKFSTLIPFTDALMDEDPILFEYLIDPQKVSYDIDVVGLRSLKLSTERLRKFVLPAIRRGVRYSSQKTDRLHRAARIPWKSAFGELKRIVLECNRYPKTNDAWVIGKQSVSMALFYRYARKGYRQHINNEHSYLKLYQIRDLESLPLWRSYGMQGPYPWEECLRTLRDYLKAHGAVPPLDVHKGGYIGLDATPFERLSGTLMHINQSDAHDKMRLDPAKQKFLEDLCKPYGFKWRKRRDSSGKVLPGEKTFITESYEEFKKLYEARHRNRFQEYLDQHFPGYPEKHERMEDLRNLRKGCVPPRRVSRDECSEPYTAGRVMCRVCRRHIAVKAWDRHLKSQSHLAKLGEVTL
ncbi:helicase-like protein [Trypanosoma rangeli SC58]|uniref:Probable helicase A859L n=1 Tax=Trypanosoma rangeli SC58 TaxID=429131 RepID=A0A061J8L4_TRYRA|nr:helicase-like protein [Trypanosoma rangeli SC58]